MPLASSANNSGDNSPVLAKPASAWPRPCASCTSGPVWRPWRCRSARASCGKARARRLARRARAAAAAVWIGVGQPLQHGDRGLALRTAVLNSTTSDAVTAPMLDWNCSMFCVPPAVAASMAAMAVHDARLGLLRAAAARTPRSPRRPGRRAGCADRAICCCESTPCTRATSCQALGRTPSRAVCCSCNAALRRLMASVNVSGSLLLNSVEEVLVGRTPRARRPRGTARCRPSTR